MNLLWHIIRKDLIRFRLILLGWVLLLAGKYLFLAQISGIFGHPSLYWLRQFEFPTPFYLAVVVLPAVIAYFLVAALVFEDPPAGRDPFWVTRPISGAQLFAAKFLFAFLMFVLGPLLAALPWWLACGFGADEIVRMAGFTGGAYLLIVLLGLAMAGVTNGYPRYFVWTLAGLAAVWGAHISPLIFGMPGKMTPAYYFSLLAACVAVLSVEIGWHRFVVRHFSNRLPLAALTLVASVGLFIWPPTVLASLFMPDVTTFPGEDNVRVTVAGDVRTFLKGGLSLPLRVEGLPENAVPILWMGATWRSPDGKTWPVRGSSGGNQPPLRRAAWHLLQLAPNESPALVQSVNFAMAPKYADRIAAEATSVEGSVRIYTRAARLRAEVPAGPGTGRFDGGSFTVSDYTEAPGDVSFVFTVRGAYSPERGQGIGYVALLNRRTGEIIEPSKEDQRASGPHLFNDVVNVSTWMRFKIPDSKWLGESNLVVVGLADGHELNLAVPAYVRPVNHAAPLLPMPVAVPAEVMKQYAGTYRPRPGATVVIREWRGYLEMRDSAAPFRVILTPESATSFYTPYASWLFAGDGYRVDFVRDAGGRVTHFVVHQDGRDFIVPRLPDKK